jgi:KDEL-tailed cysteine endopeptidase
MDQGLITTPRRSKKLIIAAVFGVICIIGAFAAFSELSTSSTLSLSANRLRIEFKEFTKKFKKFYATEEEKELRYQLFIRELEKIEIHNSDPEKTCTLALNDLADLTEEEFQTKVGLLPTWKDSYLRPAPKRVNTTNGDINWRKRGKVARVKNQGACGSCWAFSAIGATEGLKAIKEGKLVELSEQELVDCDTNDSGCGGGLMTTAFEYIMEYGIASEEDYGYKGYEGKCKRDQYERAFQINGYVRVDANDNDGLLEALQIGPVAIAVDAGSSVFRYYSKGVITEGCTTRLNHGVLLAGTGDYNGTPYWYVKNSWGPAWGDEGYLRILRETGSSKGQCGIAMDASYPTL